MQVGDTFLLMQAAYDAIQQHVLDDGELYKTKKAEKKWYILICKDTRCSFYI